MSRSIEGDSVSTEEQLAHRIAPLQLLGPIAAGGMGVVFSARDPALRRTLAIKLLRADGRGDANERRQFLREAQLLAGLSHPNIVAIHSVGSLVDGTPFFIMDYLSGGSLAERLDGGVGLPRGEVRRTVAAIASALAAAHESGVMHRDVKPSNVLYDVDGRPQLADWGIAEVGDSRPPADQEEMSGVAGSLGYLAPEVLGGEAPGPAADVYALGVLAHRVATGQGPFSVSHPAALVAAHMHKEPARLPRAVVDPEFTEVVHRCLSKDPRQRPTALEIARRLGVDNAGVIEWPPPGLDVIQGEGPTRLVKLGRRASVATVLVTAVAASALDDGQSLPGFLTLATAAVVALVLAAVGAVQVLRLLGSVGRARLDGFDWLTLLDTMADESDDAGKLLTGAGAYGALSTRWRLRLLGARRFALAIPVVTTGVALVVLLTMSVRGPSLSWGALTLFFLVAEVLRAVPGGVESAILRELRAPTGSGSSGPDLVRSWYRSLEPLSLPRSRTLSRPPLFRMRVLRMTLTAAVLVLALVVLPVLVVGVVGSFAEPFAQAGLSELGVQATSFETLSVHRDLVLAPVPDVEASEALTHFVRLIEQDDDGVPFESGNGVVPAWTLPHDVAGLRAMVTGRASDSGTGGWLERAALGLSATERRAIARVVDDPSTRLLQELAHSSTLSIATVAWSPAALVAAPITQLGGRLDRAWGVLLEVQYMRAALRVGEGRWAAADSALRVPLSVGFRLADQDPLYGSGAGRMIATSLERIASLYELRGGDEDLPVRIRATLRRYADTSRPANRTPGRVEQDVLARDAISARAGPLSVRLAMLRLTAISHRCGSLTSVTAGPSPAWVAWLDEMRGQLVGSQLEAAYWNHFIDGSPADARIEDSLRRAGLPPPASARLVPGTLARVSDWAGNPRIGECRWYPALAQLYTAVL